MSPPAFFDAPQDISSAMLNQMNLNQTNRARQLQELAVHFRWPIQYGRSMRKRIFSMLCLTLLVRILKILETLYYSQTSHLSKLEIHYHKVFKIRFLTINDNWK